MTWIASFEDGFNPRVSPDGRYVAAGLGTGSVWDRLTNRVVRLGRAFNCGWLSPTRVAFRSDSQMFAADAPEFNPVLLDAFAGPANWNDANTGTYAVGWNGGGTGVLLVNNVERARGPEVRGAAVDHDGSVVYSEGDRALRRWLPTGQVVHIDAAQPAPAIRVGYGHVAYGYSGPSFVSLPDGRQVDVTVTPNRKEGVPCIFRHAGVIWLATPIDEQPFPGVHLRPLGSLDVITVPIPATWADVVSLGSTLLVAACDARGRLTVEEISAAAPRQRLVSPPPPQKPPIPKPEPVPMPETTMKLPDAAQDIIRAFGARKDLEPLRKGNDDQRRAFVKMVAQQLRFSLGPTWGTKRASRGRPQSKDGVCEIIVGAYEVDYQKLDGTFIKVKNSALAMWDIVNGSTREVTPGATSEVIERAWEQCFIEVAPIDHLGLASEPEPNPNPNPEPNPEPKPPSTTCPCATQVQMVLVELRALANRVEQMDTANAAGRGDLLMAIGEVEALAKASRKVVIKAGWLGPVVGEIEEVK